MDTDQIIIEPITKSNWRSTLLVKTAPEQLMFVADYEPVALVILAKSYIRAGGYHWRPLAIRVSDKVVGVVAIAEKNGLCEVFHLVIDQKLQGNGIGKASVSSILDYIRKELPECKNVSLTVHPNNDIARHIYQSSGFKDSGKSRNSESVLELTL